MNLCHSFKKVSLVGLRKPMRVRVPPVTRPSNPPTNYCSPYHLTIVVPFRCFFSLPTVDSNLKGVLLGNKNPAPALMSAMQPALKRLSDVATTDGCESSTATDTVSQRNELSEQVHLRPDFRCSAAL